MQLTARDLRGRVAWLERLAMGLSREAMLQRGAQDVLLNRERRQYLGGIHDALAGIEAPRVTLARAVRRLDRQPVPLIVRGPRPARAVARQCTSDPAA
jgi:hypothetical protein